jgi:hypothetical protein
LKYHHWDTLKTLDTFRLTGCIRQVDATPSDVNQLSKAGAVMKPGMRFALSAIEKRDVWRREVARHGGRRAYRAHDADQQAWNAALRPKRCLLAVNRKLRDIVASKLILDG